MVEQVFFSLLGKPGLGWNSEILEMIRALAYHVTAAQKHSECACMPFYLLLLHSFLCSFPSYCILGIFFL